MSVEDVWAFEGCICACVMLMVMKKPREVYIKQSNIGGVEIRHQKWVKFKADNEHQGSYFPTKKARGALYFRSSLLKPLTQGILTWLPGSQSTTQLTLGSPALPSRQHSTGSSRALGGTPEKSTARQKWSEAEEKWKHKREDQFPRRKSICQHWLRFKPICCIPGTKDTGAASYINYVHRWAKAEREQRRAKTAWFVGLSALWEISPLPLFRGLWMLLQFCSGNKSKIFVGVNIRRIFGRMSWARN